MTGCAAGLGEYQYDTAPRDLQAQRPQFCHRRQRIGCANSVWAAPAAGAKIENSSGAGFGQSGRFIEITKGEKNRHPNRPLPHGTPT
jgi:hypothetical protein